MKPFDESRYYLGKLCKRGHDYEGTGMSLRSINKRGCLLCNAIYQSRYRKKDINFDRERHRNYQKLYKLRNPEKVKEINRKSRRENRNEIRKYRREWGYKQCNSLGRYYIKQCLQGRGSDKICGKDITPKLIELKRIQLKAYRASQKYKKGELACQQNSQ